MIVCVRGDPANVHAIPPVFTTPTVGPCEPRCYSWWWLPSSSHGASSSHHAVPILHWRHAWMLIFYHFQSSLLFHKNCAQNQNGLFKNVTFTSGLSWCCCHWFGIFMPICPVVGQTYLLSLQDESPEGKDETAKAIQGCLSDPPACLHQNGQTRGWSASHNLCLHIVGIPTKKAPKRSYSNWQQSSHSGFRWHHSLISQSYFF